MDITWGAIGKVLLAGLATYVLLPGVLILRDSILWRLINTFILTGDLQIKIRRYVELVDEWNTEQAGKKRISSTDKGAIYEINERDVTPDEWHQHDRRSKYIGSELRALKLHIDRKAMLLTWLLTHYQQEAMDPINEWKANEEKRLESRKNG